MIYVLTELIFANSQKYPAGIGKLFLLIFILTHICNYIIIMYILFVIINMWDYIIKLWISKL